MKRRQGFVSNSSSSSFIIGAGIVKDVNAVQSVLDKNVGKYDYYMASIDDMLIELAEKYEKNQKFGWETYRIKHTRDLMGNITIQSVETEGFTGDTVSVKLDGMPFSTRIVMVNMTGSADEDDFSVYDEDGEFSHYDYDNVELSPEEDEILGMFYNREMFSVGESSFGAGRDG